MQGEFVEMQNDGIVGERLISPKNAFISTERSEWRDLFCSAGNRSLDFARDDKKIGRLVFWER